MLRLAGLALNSGCGGIVASAQEAARLRQALGSGFVLVTPGIRPVGAVAAEDQARVVTPEDAIRAGADYLVVGRPITAADDPVRGLRATSPGRLSVPAEAFPRGGTSDPHLPRATCPEPLAPSHLLKAAKPCPRSL